MVIAMQANENSRMARNGHIGNARLSVRDSYLMLSSTSGSPHQTTAIMNAHEKRSGDQLHHLGRRAPAPAEHVEQLRDQRDGEVRFTPLRDAEVEEHAAEDEEGDRVRLPLERAAEDVAPPDLEQREQGGADEQHRRDGRQDAVLERPPGGVRLLDCTT